MPSTIRPEPQEAASHALLEWLLELSDSLLTFRARYARQPDWPAVVELLVFDDDGRPRFSGNMPHIVRGLVPIERLTPSMLVPDSAVWIEIGRAHV